VEGLTPASADDLPPSLQVADSRPIEWLDRKSVGDVHDDAVTFTLTAPVGLDMLSGHLTWRPRVLATRYRW
jgi:hypothetical protein